MKKILHISKYYYPFRGGTEQTAQDCVNALKNEYEQRVFCFNHSSDDLEDDVDNINVIRAGCFAKIFSQSLSLSYKRLLKETMDSYDPDIVIFHYPNPFGAHFLLKYLSPHAKFIIYWHLDIVKQTFLLKFFESQNRLLIKCADRIIATSPNYINGSHWLNPVANKCIVIPSCININRFQMNTEVKEIERRIKSENVGKIICLAVGRHTEYKGFTYLIKASKYLDNRFHIYIIGRGEQTKKLKKLAKGDKKIKFLGFVSDTELKAYMSAMDIFCFPSITKNEAFGLALVEAMYYEKSPVTFTIEGSGVNYVSLDRETGIEVPNKDEKAYADAMIKLADHPELRIKYGKAAKKRVVENFLDSDFNENVRKGIGSVL